MPLKRPNLVEQVCDTNPGTGDVVVSGSVAYRRTFADALVDGDTVEAMIVADDGSYEHGIYEWDEPTLTLLRGGAQVVLESSSGGAVAFGPGTKKVYSTQAAETMKLAVKHNLASYTDPTINDDASAGYTAGSRWINSYQAFECFDATLGAAQWMRLLRHHDTDDDAPTTLFKGRLQHADQSAWYFFGGLNLGGVDDTTTFPGNDAVAEAGFGVLAAVTTDATPKIMGFKGDSGYGEIYCEGASCTTITGTVSALDRTSGDVKSWKVEAVVQTDAAGANTIVAGAAPVELYESAGATPWSIAVVDVNDYQVSIQVTGEAATGIVWSASLMTSTAVYY